MLIRLVCGDKTTPTPRTLQLRRGIRIPLQTAADMTFLRIGPLEFYITSKKTFPGNMADKGGADAARDVKLEGAS